MSLSVSSVGITQKNLIPLKSNSVNFQGKKSFNDEYSSNDGVKTSTKFVLGTTALASIVALFIAGRKGLLGQKIQKFLGKAEKAFEKGSTKTNETAPKAEEIVTKSEIPVKKPEEVVVKAKPNVIEEPKSIAQILKEAGIVDDKLVKVLEEDGGISLKVVKESTYKDWESFVGELRESGKYGDKIKKIAYIFPKKMQEVLMKEGVDVSKLPKNTYLISALDANEKTLCSRLVIADKLSADLEIRQVRPYAYGTGCNTFDI